MKNYDKILINEILFHLYKMKIKIAVILKNFAQIYDKCYSYAY